MELIGPVLIVSHFRSFSQNVRGSAHLLLGRWQGPMPPQTLCTALPTPSVCKAFSKDVKKCKETRDVL